jgi:hypothetical protein
MPKITTARINSLFHTISDQPGKTPRDYEHLTGIASKTIIVLCQKHAPSILSSGKIAVNPNPTCQPDWFLNLKPKQQARVPLKISERPPQYKKRSIQVGDPDMIQHALALKEEAKARFTKTYSMTVRKRAKWVSVLSELDDQILAYTRMVAGQANLVKVKPRLPIHHITSHDEVQHAFL